MTDWSLGEVEATVADYFEMLGAELSGAAYNKTNHRRLLARRLRDRSHASIEFKHANISAVLIDLGFPTSPATSRDSTTKHCYSRL